MSGRQKARKRVRKDEEGPEPKKTCLKKDASQMAQEIIEYCKKSVKGKDVKWSECTKESEKRVCLKKLKLFNDPIHGSILLNPLECAIINTPEFYRLRDIKQLGGKSHVYPGAVHTRFEHSIGVCHLAGEFVKHLRQPSQDAKTNIALDLITPEEEKCIRIAGLCHDLGHGPFSHIFEHVKEEIMKEVMKEKLVEWNEKEKKKRKHEAISVLMFKKILLEHPEVLNAFVNCNLDIKHVKMIEDMINCSEEDMKRLKDDEQTKKRIYLYEIVANKSSGLDVDKWDYFARDCYFLGVKNEFDMRRCITLSKIVEFRSDKSRHIAFRDKEYQSIYGMFRTRCMIYQKAISHKVVCAIEMMLKDAMVEAKDLQLFKFLPQQQSLKKILQAVYGTPADLSGYVHLSDNILYRILEHHDSKATPIVDRIIKRDIYSCDCDDDEIRIPGKKKFKITKARMKQLKPKIEDIRNKKKYGYEINVATIAYASEKKDPDPVEEVQFYFKEDESSVVPKIDESRRPTASQVTTPESFIEYKVRLFRTIPKISDDASEDLKLQDGSNKKKALEWFKNETKKLLQSCDCCCL